MSTRMTIILDVDGVLADFTYGFTTLLHDQFKTPIMDTVHQQRWDFNNIPTEHVNWGWEYVRFSRTFWKTLPRLLTSVEAMQLRGLQYEFDLVFVTHRIGTDVAYQTQKWLEDQCEIENPVVLASGNKGELAFALRARYLIDDKVGNAVYAAYHCKELGTQVYLLDRPYNQFDQSTLGGSVTRVKTLVSFFDDVEKGVADE